MVLLLVVGTVGFLHHFYLFSFYPTSYFFLQTNSSTLESTESELLSVAALHKASQGGYHFRPGWYVGETYGFGLALMSRDRKKLREVSLLIHPRSRQFNLQTTSSSNNRQTMVNKHQKVVEATTHFFYFENI